MSYLEEDLASSAFVPAPVSVSTFVEALLTTAWTVLRLYAEVWAAVSAGAPEVVEEACLVVTHISGIQSLTLAVHKEVLLVWVPKQVSSLSLIFCLTIYHLSCHFYNIWIITKDQDFSFTV